MRVLAAAALALIAAAPARADCDHFKWSVAREREAFAAAPAALAAEGGSASVGAAYAVALAKDLPFPLPPERAPAADRFGAVVAVPAVERAGLYQITLSGEAWIDVAQNGARVKSSDFSGQTDCPGVRKTVRFNLAAGPATVQLSNAASDRLLMAITPAP